MKPYYLAALLLGICIAAPSQADVVAHDIPLFNYIEVAADRSFPQGRRIHHFTGWTYNTPNGVYFRAYDTEQGEDLWRLENDQFVFWQDFVEPDPFNEVRIFASTAAGDIVHRSEFFENVDEILQVTDDGYEPIFTAGELQADGHVWFDAVDFNDKTYFRRLNSDGSKDMPQLWSYSPSRGAEMVLEFEVNPQARTYIPEGHFPSGLVLTANSKLIFAARVDDFSSYLWIIDSDGSQQSIPIPEEWHYSFDAHYVFDDRLFLVIRGAGQAPDETFLVEVQEAEQSFRVVDSFRSGYPQPGGGRHGFRFWDKAARWLMYRDYPVIVTEHFSRDPHQQFLVSPKGFHSMPPASEQLFGGFWETEGRTYVWDDAGFQQAQGRDWRLAGFPDIDTGIKGHIYRPFQQPNGFPEETKHIYFSVQDSEAHDSGLATPLHRINSRSIEAVTLENGQPLLVSRFDDRFHRLMPAGNDLIVFSGAPGDQAYGPRRIRDAVKQRMAASTMLSGSWFDRRTSGEGFMLHALDEDSAIGYYYGFDQNGDRLWLIGQAEGPFEMDQPIRFNLSDANSTGAVFGDVNRDTITLQDWGTLDIYPDDCDNALALLKRDGERKWLNLQRLAGVSGVGCGRPAEASSVIDPVSGSWYEPASSGQGFSLHAIDQDRGVVYYYGYDQAGNDLWLIGTWDTTELQYGETLSIEMIQVSGGDYPDFDPDTLERTPWGSLSLTFQDCRTASATLDGEDGATTLALRKLGDTAGVACN